MKRLLYLFCIAGLLLGTSLRGQALVAASASGSGTFNNSADLLIDGVTPPENTGWSTDLNVWWSGLDPAFTIDLGGTFLLTDIAWSVDNNDSYALSFSTDGSSFASLFTVGVNDGNVTEGAGGMDTMNSFAGDAEYVAAMDFTAVAARYLRVTAVAGGDELNAVGEVTAYGTAIPEPSTYALLFGAAALALVIWRRRLHR